MAIINKYIGESKLKDTPIKKLKIALADGCVTSDKLDHEAVNEINLSSDLQSRLLSGKTYVAEFTVGELLSNPHYSSGSPMSDKIKNLRISNAKYLFIPVSNSDINCVCAATSASGSSFDLGFFFNNKFINVLGDSSDNYEVQQYPLYSKPSGGIPKSDLNAEVTASLDLANTAIQDITMKADKVANATDGNLAVLNASGNLVDGGRSMSYFVAQSSFINLLSKIPLSASSDNKLTDTNFVNSSIATNTATFRGTNTSAVDESAFLTWANALTHDNNDYVFWCTTDDDGNTIYKRYKYTTANGWNFEYALNNSSFTQTQWEAINSGITGELASSIVGKYEKPSGGIGTDDLSSAVNTSLGKADTAVQPTDTIITGKADKALMTAGTYKSVTVNKQGIVTAGSNPTTIEGYGITDVALQNGVITIGNSTITPLVSTDIENKADKASPTTNGNFAVLNSVGNYVDGNCKPDDFKTKQTAVTDPTANGNSYSYIDTISQNTNGVITATKKTIPDAVASSGGAGGTKGLMSAADKEKLDGVDYSNKADKVSSAVNGNLAGLDSNGNLTNSNIAATNIALKSEMSVADGTGTSADKTTITLKSGTSATVLKSHQSLTSKQDVIDTTHKLSADLIDDASTTNKFVTASDKTAWNGKQDALVFNTAYDAATNKVATMSDMPTTMVASGSSHAGGLVPDTPSTAGTTKFLREDGTWVAPDVSGKEDKMTIATSLPSNPDPVEVGKYYKLSNVESLTINLPTISGATTVQGITFLLATASNNVSVSFNPGSGVSIYYQDGFLIDTDGVYEVTALWNGTSWTLTIVEFVAS